LIKKNDKEKISSDDTNQSLENKNNLIKNLRYDVNFENNTKYNITADLSELIYEGNNEIVKMQKVKAIFIDKSGLPLIITAANAMFNNTSYNTTFSNNVKIKYINNEMRSEKLLLDFENNVVIINDNIVYEGVQGIGEADNIKIDLITKDIQIFMNNSNNKVKITSKKINE
tara:strand:+ start:1327 stop:1839 length:513 start_codon:yes stop_codon:yes gene_type:complete